MLTKKSMLLFVSCWLLLAVVSLPSGASAATSPQMSDAGTVYSDTFPIMENQFTVRQAQLVYLAVKEELFGGKTAAQICEDIKAHRP